MKKTAVLIISFALVFSTFVLMLDMNVEGKDIAPAPLFTGEGSGTAADPYEITDVDELQEMNDDLNANYTLMGNIDASITATWDDPPGGDIEGFVPIGNSTSRFNGTLDGQDFKIIGLTIYRLTTNNVGLFGHANDTGIIQNVILEYGDITGQGSVGSIAGMNYGSIVNCHSSVNVSGSDMIGGFVGTNDAILTDCSSHGAVDGTGDYIGGFVGIFEGEAINCMATGDVSGSNGVGGFIGRVHTGGMKNCQASGSVSGVNYVGGFAGGNTGIINASYSTGSVSGTGESIGGFAGTSVGSYNNCYSTGSASGIGADVDNIGGFLGYSTFGTIMNSYSNGNAVGPDSDSAYVGGFAGRSAATISNCYSTGSATTPGDAVGGFTGSNAVAGVVIDSYATGNADITGPGWEIGGFSGQNHGTIERCYSLGDATTAGGGIAGGFVGNNYNIITDCFARGNADASSDRAGGFAGYNSNGDTITSSYSIGTVSGGFEGGFAGENGVGSTISISHWDTTISGTGLGVNINSGTAGVTGHVTAVMKQQGTFSGWDFANVWGIVQDNTYPFFTTIDPIIINEQITLIGMATEDVEYSMDFNSTTQPIPFYNEVENWTLNSDADWLSISPFNGVVSGTPVNADIGTYYVNLTATDTLGSEGNFNYTLVVENTGLTITTIDVDTTNTGALYSVDYDSTDDPSTTWSLAGNATGWLSIDNDGILSGTPSNAEADIYNVEVTVDDGNGETDTQIFLLTVNLDTDGDGDPDETDTDDDNDGVLDGNDDFPLDPDMISDHDGDGIDDSDDLDDDDDGWDDAIEITGGFDPLDNSSMPGDADSDGIADYMDPDFLVTTEYNNVTVWNNATADLDADSDNDDWSDIVEILAGTDEQDDTDTPSDTDGDGIADFMDPDFLTTEVPVYNNNTIWNNDTADPQTVTETPIWAWGAVIAAAVMGVLAVIGFMRGGSKPEPVEKVPEPELEEPNIEKEETE